MKNRQNDHGKKQGLAGKDVFVQPQLPSLIFDSETKNSSSEKRGDAQKSGSVSFASKGKGEKAFKAVKGKTGISYYRNDSGVRFAFNANFWYKLP